MTTFFTLLIQNAMEMKVAALVALAALLIYFTVGGVAL